MSDEIDESHDEPETSPEVEAALRALAGQDPDGETLPAPADERLRAWREGRLNAEEARELEGLLAGSAAGRRRLLELAHGDLGIDRSLPLRRVRKAVLERTARRRAVRPWMAAAAAVAATILVALIALYPRPGGLPKGLAYEVAARGLAEVRAVEEGGSDVRAYPGTPLRIAVRPRREGFAGAAFGLYRREGGALRRVRQPAEVRLVTDRGSAAFEGTAGRLLAARAPGAYPLYVVVSAREDLPALVSPEPGQDPAAVLRSADRLVYPITVTLLRDEPAEDGKP